MPLFPFTIVHYCCTLLHGKTLAAPSSAMDKLIRSNRRYAKSRWGSSLNAAAFDTLKSYSEEFRFSAAFGDLLFLDKGWYVTNSGLTRLAHRNRCTGIYVQPVLKFCDPAARRWTFRAIVYRT